MQQPEKMREPDSPIPQALQALEPAPMRHGMQEIWYQAGVKTGRRQVNSWRAVAAAAVVAVACMVAFDRFHSSRPSITVVQGTVNQASPMQSPVEEQDSSPSAAYTRLVNTLLANGLSGLPTDEAGTGEVRTDSSRSFDTGYSTDERG